MPVPRTMRDEWVEILRDEFESEYFKNIIKNYKNALQNEVVFPPRELIFNAFNLTKPQDIKVVILGQDPYHNSVFVGGVEVPQAMGLSFSVPPGVTPPPSLKNIYKELEANLNFKPPKCANGGVSGDLSLWASRGVFLLNSILSVKKNAPASHRHFGWEIFTDNVIRRLSDEYRGIVFLLWGNFAKKKESLIDKAKHAVITAPHPSPLARGFLGSQVFLKANEALSYFNKSVDWELNTII
ncbi:uracil-DNA glycosylase [Helicobacter saguini]|uniref:Uracil-DNA glycosylase n=1 Tax=Helicobacter saguini TaxID=1548018 RepID=A0A347VNZ3_9HELI|nr:uracil-DNA glycosylase [Helicobacter saguini]MWV61574.1 uracil-DNA glycosylase [Helicobacter saguini]MWV67755.1 uracil-DNA glycosylase [Helicobacter saguini]MWV70777.1 uracil-DNA glycosylase [Helicobacter saguini]MWV72681.1 uracil-DNA glycosylase [Helicobacter saguini]TLD94516.1 uracil-DNA glycosylase [Helicobacter saguini]